jgi:phenylacetate-CoA ligase
MTNVGSSIMGIRWPAIAGDHAAALRGLLQQFDRSQYYTDQELEAAQNEQLAELLTHAFEHVPFYGKALQEAGYAPGTALTRELWERISVLERGDVQRHGLELRSSAVPRAHGQIAQVATSGSTGMPIGVLKTEVAVLYW